MIKSTKKGKVVSLSPTVTSKNDYSPKVSTTGRVKPINTPSYSKLSQYAKHISKTTKSF